jgi:hypothetical protein
MARIPATWQERRAKALGNRTVHERRQVRRSEYRWSRPKKVTTGKTLTIGAIPRRTSVYRDIAIVNDDLAEQIGNKQTMFVMQAFVTDKRGADTAQGQEGPEENNQEILHYRRVRP